MSKILRIYKDGATTYQDWNESPSFPYNSHSRESIVDPDGDTAQKEITSIPSPFARMDLVKNAFKEVCKVDNREHADLDGRSIHHKTVSDTLDIGELFFNIDKLSHKLEIITWHTEACINELKTSSRPGHVYLGDALEKYMLSDAKTYNFGRLQNIYLLNYLDGPDELNIIGATSPSTVFFSTANKLDYVGEDINFGTSHPFDSNYQPLYRRDPSYIKAWFVLRSNIPDFATLFPEVDSYLTHTLHAIQDQSLKKELINITDSTRSQYSEIDVTSDQKRDTVEVLGYPLLKKNQDASGLQSDFEIMPTRSVNDRPLVLPVESGGKYSELKYNTSEWGKDNKAPYVDAEPDIHKRILPYDGLKKSYLTIGDLLEDSIVCVPHKMNDQYFFNGNLDNNDKGTSYLLPLKREFFNYFSAADLLNPLPDGKNILELQELAGNSVKCYLRIPIKGNGKVKYVEYTRIYYNSKNADITKNEGFISIFDFASVFTPMVEFINDEDAYYKISCVSTYSSRYNWTFVKGNETVSGVYKDCRNTTGAQEMYKADVYTVEKSNIDYCQISDEMGNSGILVPKFKRQSNINSYEFSVDLGTSNTHIEYRKSSLSVSQPFSFDMGENIICHTFVPTFDTRLGFQKDLETEDELIERDMLPDSLNKNVDYHFPTRTILSAAKVTNWQNVVRPMGMTNIPFTYDKRRDLQYNDLIYNIKWQPGDNMRYMESYVENLALMIRNKVLMNDGDLSKTKITWFYPLSMPPKKVTGLRMAWNNIVSKYFPGGESASMSESAAPILYFFKKYATATSMINVDIGGGTTDIAFAKNKEIQYVTSFRFASNTLFENSFSDVDQSNGIVDAYKEYFLRILESDGNLSEIVQVYNSENNQKPSNMASFLFSLRDNSLLKNLNPGTIDFNSILQNDEDFKIVFILFYTSIIYHIAKIIKVKGLDVPRHITFSGNGSKILKVITPDISILSKFTKTIFEKVLETRFENGLDLLGLDSDSDPKESTSKGGLIDAVDNTDRDKIIKLRANGESMTDYDDTLSGLDDAYIKSASSSVRQFLDFVLNDLNRAFNFDDNFGVSYGSLTLAREICYNDMETYIRKGIEIQKEESEDDSIQETLFFYPIKGALNELSRRIKEQKTIK